MDSYTFVPAAPITHSVELYTARFLVRGVISGSFKRTSDLLNQRDHHFITVEGAALTQVGQQVDPRKLGTPATMNKRHVHLVAATPQGQAQAPGGTTREFYVQKESYLCYVLTDTFVVHGHCHLHQGANLQSLLEMGDTFLPITNPAISLLSLPNAPWRRDLVLINKEKLEVMYLVET